MVFNSGFGSNAKVVKYRLRPEEGQAELYSLTPRMVKALLSNTDYLAWMNRHHSMPDDINTLDQLEGWVSKLNLALMSPVIIDCEFLKDCLIDLLANDPDVLQTLIDLLGDNEEFRDRLNQGGYNPGTNPTVVSEDLDALFGAVTFIVDTMHDLTVDAFQIWESGSTARERTRDIIAAIPIIETLPIDDIQGFIDTMYEDVVQEFEGEYTTTPQTGVRDTYRCALFCIARNNDNTLSFDDVVNYFSGRVGFTQNPVALLFGLAQFVIGGTWEGLNVPDISFLNTAIILRAAGKLAGMTLPTFDKLMQLGLNNPDPDWATLDLCAECATSGDLNIIALPLWEEFVHWEFQFKDGDSEIWDVTVDYGALGVWTSFTGIDETGKDFYILETTVLEGTWIEKGEIDGVNYPSGLPTNVIPNDYFARFSDSWPAKMRCKLLPL